MMEQKNEILLIGYSGHGLVAAEAILLAGYRLKGYLEKHQVNYNPYELEYFGFESDPEVLEKILGFKLFPAIGSNAIRRRVYENLVKKGMHFMTAIHPNANVTKYAKLGNATLICQGACINPASVIGNGVIINTGAIIEHECKIGDFSHVAPGAVLCGNVTVGKGSLIGANAVVKEGVKIGEKVLVGAGSVVLYDVQDNQVLYGNPAKTIS